MKYSKLFVAVLVVALVFGAVSAMAQTIPLEGLPAKAPAKSLVFNLNWSPIGQVFDLPSWACGNITVTDARFDAGRIEFAVNIPLEFLQEGSRGPYALRTGEVGTIGLKNGVVISFYWKRGKIKDDGTDLELVVQRHCPVGGCKNLCNCK